MLETRRILLDGQVQGVGFRPFVYRLATRLGVRGEVRNITGRVEVLVQAPASLLDRLERALIREAPDIARPRIVVIEPVQQRAFTIFSIAPSATEGECDIRVPPDYFTCPDCLRELADPDDRRHAYPFINCTQCGPRYTLIAALPYDRPNTSMAGFPLCPACAREYASPSDRRFHAEPLACPECGPQLRFQEGEVYAEREQALGRAIERLRQGAILAIKGVGGYHLACDASDEQALQRLRARKRRPDKPLAVMFPAPPNAPLSTLERYLTPGAAHREALISTHRPIVLCTRRPEDRLASGIAPGLEEIGAMLPYSPMHHLLLQGFDAPLVMTSGNLSGEPVLTDQDEAESRLAPIADAYLHHNRPILRPADDSVVRVIGGAAVPIRVGRGLAPLDLALPYPLSEPVLALGGQMKNSIALGWDRRLVVSPHIGDLDSPRGLQVFEQVVADLQRLYGVQARRLLCDAHPGYASHRWARDSGLPYTPIQHHRAHASALALDGLDAEAIVFTWDGTGYGDDGHLWGGEAFIGRPGHWRRFASLRPFRLPGGERAGREPWRSAAALCWECRIPYEPPGVDARLARAAWGKSLNAPSSQTVGRLFDAAAALIGVCTHASFEGQGPMQLEALCRARTTAMPLPLERDNEGLLLADWAPLLPILRDLRKDPVWRASYLHEALAQTLLAIARAARSEQGTERIGLTGGVFQNRVLCERAVELAAVDGFDCVLGQALPVNDGGISAGQVLEYVAGGGA